MAPIANRMRLSGHTSTEGDFLADLYGKLVAELAIERVLDIELPAGVTAQLRTDGEMRSLFVQNYNRNEVTLTLDGEYTDLLSGDVLSGSITLERYAVRVLRR